MIRIVFGSISDWETMRAAASTLSLLEVPFSAQVLSAHRMPDDMFRFAERCDFSNTTAIIAGAGGAAHLPGMIAAKTAVPVLGVPIRSEHLQGIDSLYSIIQMPKGIPVATFAIGEAGAVNAALFGAALYSSVNERVMSNLKAFRESQTTSARQSDEKLREATLNK
jgi:5-(carboxyamino)imidazole ribonucleotide mutase